MGRYIPRVQQVLAEQFDGTRSSVRAIEALPGVFVKVREDTIFVLIEKRWTHLNITEWVVRSRRDISIMTNEDFQLLYEVAL